jgi:phage-related baseplate assembly protein
VKDARAVSPVAGQVVVTILSHEGNGTASEEVLNNVRLALNNQDVRPITDEVVVQSVEIVEFQLTANITFFDGPSHKPVLDLIATRWQDYAAKSHSIGFSLEESAVMAACHQNGVWRVDVLSPVLPLTVDIYQAAYCTLATFNDNGNGSV